jgi:glucose-1-phosphate adenylyltransferase
MAGRGERGMLGIVVHGSGGPLEPLGVPADAALTPFAGSYRFLDLALATLANSGVRTPAGRRDARGPQAVPSPHGRGGRAARVLEALRRLSSGSRLGGIATVAVLSADHVLQVDLRELHTLHRELGADVTLAGLPVPFGEREPRTMLLAGSDRGLVEARRAAPTAVASLSWAGDLLVSARAIPAVLAALAPDAPRDDVSVLTRLAGSLRVIVHDVVDTSLPGVGHTYWHEPTSIEAYYAAQMDLCGQRPALDLFNPAWPLPAAPGQLGPARIGLDDGGNAAHAVSCLVADGVVMRGGYAATSVLGRGVVVECGAEVEDCLLMDNCHIGRGAHLRRAIVTAGAVVPEGAEIGWSVTPEWAQARTSGLTIVAPRLRRGATEDRESSAIGA